MGTDIYFNSNPAEWPLLEGMYIAERDPPGFIQGVDLSTVGLAGKTMRGPLTAQSITSPARFIELYGPLYHNGILVNEIAKALINKRWGEIIVRRVLAAAAVTASFTLETTAGGAGTAVLRIDASSPGSWGNDVGVKVEAAEDGIAGHFNLRARLNGKEQLWKNLNIQVGSNNVLAVMGDDPSNFIVATKLADGRPVNHAAGVDGADTDGFVKLGQVVAGFVSVVGTEGALAASDYIAGVTELASFDGIDIVLVPDSLEETVAPAAQATLNTALVTLASEAVDRIFLTWSGKYNQSIQTEKTNLDAQITTKSDRIWWVMNGAKTLDPITATKVSQGPHIWLASAMTQIDVDIHPGSVQASKFLAGIAEVYTKSFSRSDLKYAKANGLIVLERLRGGFQFRSVVTTDLTPGKKEGTRRRMADFLQLSAADRLRVYVKGKGTPETRAQMAGELTSFSEQLKGQNRIIKDFQIKQEEVNTELERSQGNEHLLWRVDLIDHVLALILDTEIGTGVVIERQAA